VDIRRNGYGKGGGAPARVARGTPAPMIYCYCGGLRQACPDGESVADLIADGAYFHLATAAVTPDAAVCLGLFANPYGHGLLVIDFDHPSLPGVVVEADDAFQAAAALRDLAALLRLLGVRAG
jgi:hypothetical protein